MRDRLRALCVRVVPLTAAVVAIALVTWLAYGLSKDTQGARAGPSRGAAAVAGEVPAQVPPDAGSRAEVRTATAFVRRLEVGADLRQLLDDVEEKGVAAARFADRYERAKPFLLAGDGKPEEGERPTRTLLRLTEPRRDLASLVLAGATGEDPGGSSMRVRIWTRKTAYPEEGRARIAAALGHIVRCVGREMTGGTDVLITPRMGKDVFPGQPAPWRALGLYLPGDRYGAVRSKLPPDLVVEVAKHECIHAYHLSMRSPSKSRLIGEGLAEYLRLVEPSDRGLDVPSQRLADSCAELRRILELLREAGVATDGIDPRRLVDLQPKEFYALGHLGYLIGQLAMAYVGGDVIEPALAGDTDAALVDAVRRIGWADFVRFVDSAARGGVIGRLRIVEDPDESEASGNQMFRTALQAAGAELSKGAKPDRALARVGRDSQLEENLERALELIRDGPWAPRISVDLSEAMDRPVRLAPVPPPVAELLRTVPRGDTPRRFTKEVIVSLAAQRRVEVVGLAKERHVGGAEVLDFVEPFHIASVGEGATPCVDFLVVASPGVAADAVGLAGDLASILLIVDFTPDGEAIEIARTCDEHRLVAYWRPVADE